MNIILAIMVAATVSLQTVKLGTAPGKTMVVTGATVSAHAEITNTVTKAYVEGLGIEAGVKSVNSKTGTVMLVASDVGALSSEDYNQGYLRFKNRESGYAETISEIGSSSIYFCEMLNDEQELEISTYGRDVELWDGDVYVNHDGQVAVYGGDSIKLIGQDTKEHKIIIPLTNGTFAIKEEIPDISFRVTTNTVTKEYVQSLGVSSGVTSVNSKTGAVTLVASDVGAASSAELAPIAADVRTAYGYSRGTYLYMNANTNAWFAGTNYVFGADATNRTQFAWEAGMNTETVPCSMALYELRDGAKQCVWDQRDWTAWYWSFKASQMDARIQEQMAASNAAIRAEIASTNNHAWAKWYAASGRINPDPTTTYVDTPKVCIAPGMNWETVAQVSGCGYWTIVANGLVVGNAGTNAVLEIKDFEGNSIMTITKGQHRLAWLESEDFTGQMIDGDGWVCFDMMSESQPTGYFSTTLEEDSFVVQTDANCPAQYRWESVGSGKWRVHFLLKPGIVSNRCFAKFLSEIQGQTVIRYTAGAEISGGLIYNGKKIAPQIPSGAVVGDTITWKVVQ